MWPLALWVPWAAAALLITHGLRVPAATEARLPALALLPYPQQVSQLPGRLALGPLRVESVTVSATVGIAERSLASYLPKRGPGVVVRIGSLEEGYNAEWIPVADRQWLEADGTSSEASFVRIEPAGITVVGKGRWGMLYGVQTVNQLAQDQTAGHSSIPCMAIRDWPDMKWRCLSPQMTWYSGYNRLEGYDCGNWTLDEWKWLVDWSLLHKCNAWAMCMYGNWPFTLPGYPETTLDVPSFRYNPKTGRREAYCFVHRNIRHEFLPALIRYANERGIRIYAYIGKNSFNGTYGLRHPDANAGGAAELIPFHLGVQEYWDAVIKRLVGIGFNGFVFEDPEALHVPNQNEACWHAFWEPWAKTYGFKSAADTDQNKPPLGVHVEYYTWLFRTFDGMIRKHAAEMHGPEPEIYLISHILLSRMVSESKTQAERDRWFALIDEKQGRKVPFVILEADENRYVSFLGGHRVASLGGRGGSCTNAMRRIPSINNNWVHGGMGGDLAYERQCQKRIYEAGGLGTMGYIFEWTNTEVFGYLAAQYLWRSAGVPGIDNENQTGFLQYAYRLHYGDRVGRLVAQAMDEGSCVNEAMMLEGVQGSQYPETGAPLHRDYQYLAVLADRTVQVARKAFRAYTGQEPPLDHPMYREESFRWNGYDPQADHLFKAERLRLLNVGAVRSQHMCRAVLAHRKAQRLIAEGAPVRAVLGEYDRAIAESRANERLYQVNYDDDYDWTDGLCSKVTEALESQRDQFVASVSTAIKPAAEWDFSGAGGTLGWSQVHDAALPLVKGGALVVRATGPDSFVVQANPLRVPVGKRSFLEIQLAADRAGRLRVFWATEADIARQPAGVYPFSEARVRTAEVAAGSEMAAFRVSPDWEGTLNALRIDIPKGSTVRIASVRIVDVPEGLQLARSELARPVPESVRSGAQTPLHIPWEAVKDITPPRPSASKPGLYLSVHLGCDAREDYFRLGVTFSVESPSADGKWRTIFRRSVGRRETGWQHWDIPLADPFPGPSPSQGEGSTDRTLRFRLVTDSFSRAQNRSEPTWRWALWGRPEIVRVEADGSRRVLRDLTASLDRCKPQVRLDSDGQVKPFSGPGEDLSGATFGLAVPASLAGLRAGELKERQWIRGFARWQSEPPHHSYYRSYLGDVMSGWAYRAGEGELTWETGPAPTRRATVVAWVGGTGYAPGKAELWCDGRRLITFDMARPENARWAENGVELRYLHGGDTRSETITYGISGIYVLLLPPEMITPGRPLTLTAKLPPGAGDWFMVHEFPDPESAAARVVYPEPAMPAIAAFTPHRSGQFGVTIGEFAVQVPGRG